MAPLDNRTINQTGTAPDELRDQWPHLLIGVNWRGLWTLYRKEVLRFVNVYMQTIAAPLVTSLLFFAVFSLALGRVGQTIGGVAYGQFLAGGLIIMTMVQNAFANTSSSLIIAKIQGNIVDVLMPPLSAAELTAGFALAGTTRGVVVGIVVALGMLPFVDLSVAHWGYLVYHAVMGSLMLSLLGVIGALWAQKFDHIAAVTNFIVMPLSFLSGTFYSVARLPDLWRRVIDWNPFFYMIDGFRYGLSGHADGALGEGLLVIGLCNAALAVLTYRLFATGYKIKA